MHSISTSHPGRHTGAHRNVSGVDNLSLVVDTYGSGNEHMLSVATSTSQPLYAIFKYSIIIYLEKYRYAQYEPAYFRFATASLPVLTSWTKSMNFSFISGSMLCFFNSSGLDESAMSTAS